ncbi:MAG: class I adenylate-forming enzyme family protein [Acidimicrobiales bacterium]
MLRTELIRPIPELLAERAEHQGDRRALRDGRLTLTYGLLADRVARLGTALRQLGVGRGDAVAIHMDNRVELAETYLGAVSAGSVATCINPAATDGEVGYMLADSGAVVVVGDMEHAGRLRALAERIPALERLVIVGGEVPGSGEAAGGDAHESDYEALLADASPDSPPPELSLDAPAFMLYTSGTTGRPKGVLLSQRSLLWMAAACWSPILGLGCEDDILSPLPLFHSYALALSVVGAVAVGASERIMPRFSPAEVVRWLREEDVTFMPGVPTMFHYLLAHARDDGLRARALRLCMSAGAIMPATLNESFERTLGVPVLDGYGITETATMVTMNWPTGTRVMGSCGLPLPGSEMRIVDPGGADVAQGQDGEILVRGPHLMLGYHNQPEATAEALAGGWYHTGDLGRRDPHGYVTITGRTKELIIRGGENIYPAEIEEVLAGQDSLLDAAVASRADEALGEVPVAFVVPRDPESFDPGPLLEECALRLSTHKVPTEIHVVDEIPRTGSGKVKRFQLRALLEARPTGGAGGAAELRPRGSGGSG